MTLPSTTILPLHSEQIQKGGKDLDRYMRDLIFTLQRQYENMAQAINGDIRTDTDVANKQFLPTIKDTVNDSTTFTYDHRVGWVLRKGLFVDVFFDVKWTANSGAITGNMYLDLPYKVAITEQKPFVGLVQPSVFSFTGGTGCVINAQSDTYRGEIWNIGDGFTTANQTSAAAGHLIGNIRYAGQGLERS